MNDLVGDEATQFHDAIKELKKKLKEQRTSICDLRREIVDLSKMFQFSLKTFIIMYMFLVYIIMK